MTQQIVTEASSAFNATAVADAPGDFLVDVITPGWGSSGYYSAEMLEQAVKDRVFSAGIHMHLDHQSTEEQYAQPAGSLKDFAAFFRENAVWNPTVPAVQVPVHAFSPYAPLLSEMKDNIGVSIRAAAEVSQGEAEGRQGQIIDRLVEVSTVDFVTHAGRGGKIVSVLESALGDTLTREVAMARLEEARNIGQWIESRLHLELTQIADDMFGQGRLTREERISLSSAIAQALTTFTSQLEADAPQLYTRDLYEEPTAFVAAAEHVRRLIEATTNDKSEALGNLVRDAYAGDKTYAWVRDFDDELQVVWFNIDGPDGSGTWQQSYTTGADDLPASLTGERTEVRPVTTFVPVAPAGQSTTQESKEDTMATTQIEEAALADLREKAGRVPQLETQLAEAEKERDEARESATKSADEARESRIAAIIAEADAQFDDLQVAGLKAGAPVKEGVLDEDAFKTTVDEAAAKVAEAGGAGSVRGFGGGSTVTKTELDLRESNDKQRAGIFGRPIKEA